VKDEVPSPYVGARAAQLNRLVARIAPRKLEALPCSSNDSL
jgi:hypothetical protein